MKRNKKINEITYRTWENNWCYGQSGYKPPKEFTINAKISNKPDSGGYYIIKPKNSEPIKVHWTNIYPYF